MEEWKKIVGYELLYEISSIGRIKSLRYRNTTQEIILKNKKERAYSRIWLSIYGDVKYCSIHRLVAQHFIPNPNNLPLVCHKDETLDENWLLYNWSDNLFWGTHKDNTQDMYKKWRDNSIFIHNHPHKWVFWKDHPRSKAILQYSFNREFIKEFESITEASRILWITASNITVCCNKEWKTAWWFRWKSK